MPQPKQRRFRPKAVPPRFEAAPSLYSGNARLDSQKNRAQVNTGETGLPAPNAQWFGYLSPENKYTLDKLQALDPGRHAAGVMHQRAKLKEPKNKYDHKLHKSKEGDAHKEIITTLVPKHEFILGRKLVTPSFVKARDRSLQQRKESLTPDALNLFGSTAEHFAKSQGNSVNGTHIAAYNLADKGAQLLFSWTEENSRRRNALTDQTEIGTMAIVTQTPEGPQTIQYSLFDDDDSGRSIHRHVWISDPGYEMPDFPSNPRALRGQELEDYDTFLAEIIENNYRMEQSVKDGNALVDAHEVIEVVSFAVNNLSQSSPSASSGPSGQ